MCAAARLKHISFKHYPPPPLPLPPPPWQEAIYFGNAHWRGNTGSGKTGPWVGADLEQGMYYGGGAQSVNNPNNIAVPFPFVTAYLRGRTDGFMLKGGDATKGTLTTMFDGARPFVINGSNTQNRHYQPSNKQGGALCCPFPPLPPLPA